MCGKEKELPVEMGGMQPRSEGRGQLAVSSHDLISGERSSGGAGHQDASVSCHSGRKGQEALSTNIWLSLESRVWRPGMSSADDYFESRCGPPLTRSAREGDMDPSKGTLMDGAHYTKTRYPQSTGAKDDDYNIGMALRSLGETEVN